MERIILPVKHDFLVSSLLLQLEKFGDAVKGQEARKFCPL